MGPSEKADPVVGRSVPRVDAVAKVTGAARYVDDLAIEGALFGRTVRSECPHGVLRAIERDPSFDWSGIVVVTAADIPGENVIHFIAADQPALVPIGGTIRHVDEPVALVAASTRARAAAAARSLRLQVDPLPAVCTLEESLAKTGLLAGDDNVYRRFQIVRGDDIDGALAACDVVVEGEYRTGSQEQMYIEPQGMISWWDEAGICHITGSMQCPYFVLNALKRLLGLGAEQVVVAQAVTGGGFGGKEEYPSMIAGHAALLARRAKAPVRLVYDRQEDIAATPKRHPALIRHRLGLRRDGTVVAADVDVVIDAGAYVTLSPVVLSRAVLHASGPYRFDHVRIVGRAVATNTPPQGAFRGFGAPQVTFAYERQIHKAARALGIDPVELRRRNMLRAGDRTATEQVLTSGVASEAVLARVTDWAAEVDGAAPSPRADDGADGRRRGRGLAFYFHGAGFTGSGEQRLKGQATVATCADGGFEVRTSSTDIGQGSHTTFAQIAASALGVALEEVTVSEPDTSRVPDSGPTVASRTCMVVGRVVEQAAQKVRARLEEFARAQLAGAEADPVAPGLVAVGREHHRRHGEMSETVTYAPPAGIEWDDETYTGAAYPTYGWAACIADVAVDPDTYEVEVERCAQAIDVGKAINPAIVEGQIEGGTLQALGWALWEYVTYENGRVANASMTDCIIPTFADAPELAAIVVEEPYEHGPHGAKGLGEIPMDGPAAAVANAIEDALGLQLDELPILPEVIERALREEGNQ